MKYCDLIQFEAVTEVIQLVTANEKETAQDLVNTYVISDRMGDVLINRMLPALHLGKDGSNRGLFIVGNYGTGKSHLMSFITSIAEHADLLSHVRNRSVIGDLESIAGKFKVSRQETSALDVPLRAIVFRQLEDDLQSMGIEHVFPKANEAVTNKQALTEMMVKFQNVFPNMGLMIALDELLDFLRQKSEKELIKDLNFLREIGEVCENLPLRFMAGIQEALFDNPRFQFVANSIQRVKSRFDEASIVREDIAYVVSHRLLAKTDGQKKLIRAHLEQFTPLYSEMAERLDDYIDLFPVHPTYLEMFENVTIGERRELLKAISQEMEELLDQELLDTDVGLITFDSYWRMIRNDNSFKAIPDVYHVLQKVKVLTDKVKHSADLHPFQEPALQIIDGLALQRLTLSDIYAPIGMTPEEIRDQLCIKVQEDEEDADFLLASVESILKDILKAVNGQFISHNKENDQFYIDLKKDIDFDALIDAKADSLDESTIDRYYYDVLAHALELNNTASYVPGFRIWECEIPWVGHGITRRGYYFLGSANERSTAHPERDFYVLFHGIYGNGYTTTEPLVDQLVFRMDEKDPEFIRLLKRYAGSLEMKAISAGSNKDRYDQKAQEIRKDVLRWIWENFLRSFSVEYCGDVFPVTEMLKKHHISTHESNFRNLVHEISGRTFAEMFSKKFPKYPSFQGLTLNSVTLLSAADAAIKAIGGGAKVKIAQSILDGLKLAKSEGHTLQWTIDESPYATFYHELVQCLGDKKVINRAELLDGEPGAERDIEFHLEPELFMVVLAALVRHGSIKLNIGGLQIAELGVDGGPGLQLGQLLHFSSIGKPQPIPEKTVRELLLQFHLDEEIVQNSVSLSLGIGQLQQNIQEELDQVVRMINNLRDGPTFWQVNILPAEERKKAREKLDDYRAFLQGLRAYTTPAHLRNLSLGVGEIRAEMKARNILRDLQRIFVVLDELRPHLDYLLMARSILSEKDDWQVELSKGVDLLQQTLADADKRTDPTLGTKMAAHFENIKSSFAKRYKELHTKHCLDRQHDERKRELSADPRWARMRSLSNLRILPRHQLDHLQEELGGIGTCFSLQAKDLQQHSHCPHCGFDPSKQEETSSSAAMQLEKVEKEFDQLYVSWIDTLLKDLQSEEAEHNLTLLNDAEREVVEQFIQTKALPEPLTRRFIDGVQNTLQGLQLVTMDGADLLLALTHPGMPCTLDELETRICDFIHKQVEGKEQKKIRIQIDW